MIGARLFALVCFMISLPVVARADRSERAKQLYQAGEADYHEGRFQAAYDEFKEAYLVSKQPAFLYDMASALEGLSRPHDAAEALRGYLRARPDAPTRSAIEGRIRGLEEAQRILDAELVKRTPPVLEPPPPPPQPWWTHRRVQIAVGVALGAAAAGIAVGVGVAYGTRGFPETTLGDHRATP
jgi:hypothetical protein